MDLVVRKLLIGVFFDFVARGEQNPGCRPSATCGGWEVSWDLGFEIPEILKFRGVIFLELTLG